MDNVNQTKYFKRIIIVLILLLLSLGVYTLVLWQESQSNRKDLEEQKLTITQELNELQVTYDDLMREFQLQDEALIEARTRIAQLLDSVESAKPSMAIIKRYRLEIARLKEERTMLFARADSTQLVLNKTRMASNDLRQKNEDLERVIEKGAQLQVIDFLSSAVIVRKSGRLVETKRASRADKIRSCFTITPNPLATPGERDLYLQVINPKNNLIGSRARVSLGEGTLSYSGETQVNYQQEEIDVCLMVGATEQDLISGRYILNLYQGNTRLTTATMYLK
jgi:BMFP domain-containing protein YqiC